MLKRNMADNAHQMIRTHLKNNNRNDLVAVDATLGNGYDLEFLSTLDEVSSLVGFDIQEDALNNSRNRIQTCSKRIDLFLDSHHCIDEYITGVDIVMFNLGYLPKGDKTIVTNAEKSLLAIQKSIYLLNEGGIMTIMSYKGHSEGLREYQMIDNYLSSLNIRSVEIFEIVLKNTLNPCPNLFVVTKGNIL